MILCTNKVLIHAGLNVIVAHLHQQEFSFIRLESNHSLSNHSKE